MCLRNAGRPRTMRIDLHELDKGSWRTNRSTRDATTASNHHCESHQPRINVSTVAAHSQIVPPCKIMLPVRGPAARAGQIAVI